MSAFIPRLDPDPAARAAALTAARERFRFNYIIGDWAQNTTEEEDEFADEDQDADLDDDTTTPTSWATLESCVTQVVAMLKKYGGDQRVYG